MGLEQLPKDDALGLALLDAYQDAYMALKRAWNRLPDHRRVGLIPPPDSEFIGEGLTDDRDG